MTSTTAPPPSNNPSGTGDRGGVSPALPIVRNLHELVRSGQRVSMISADPPWPDQNTAARGAAENPDRTLTLPAICEEPVKSLAASHAPLHLWTTNAFLREAFDVIRTWGGHDQSCLVWVQPQLGTGNDWRVSHEFLPPGVRGGLQIRDRCSRIWLTAHRTEHRREPFAFRAQIERVSPGPYLEMYGREEQPDCGWSVHGNQVERRLFFIESHRSSNDDNVQKAGCDDVRPRVLGVRGLPE